MVLLMIGEQLLQKRLQLLQYDSYRGASVPYISSLRLKMCPVSAKVGGKVVNDDGKRGVASRL